MDRSWLSAIIVALLLTSPLFAQVKARQGTPEEKLSSSENSPLTEVPSPMVLEIPLEKAKLDARPVDSVWTTRDTAKFVCDKATVTQVQVGKKRGRKGQVLLEIAPMLRTDWMRQDIDLTVALLAADGTEVGKRVWDDLTIGSDKYSMFVFGSQSKSPKLEVKLSESDLAALYANGSAPSLKIIVDIQGEEEDE
jgi:hypothetical protein